MRNNPLLLLGRLSFLFFLEVFLPPCRLFLVSLRFIMYSFFFLLVGYQPDNTSAITHNLFYFLYFTSASCIGFDIFYYYIIFFLSLLSNYFFFPPSTKKIGTTQLVLYFFIHIFSYSLTPVFC